MARRTRRFVRATTLSAPSPRVATGGPTSHSDGRRPHQYAAISWSNGELTRGSRGSAIVVRSIAGARHLCALAVAAVVGVWGLREHPLRADDVFLAVIALQKP